MTVFKSATSNYQGVKCYENKGILKKIENRFKGYIEIPLNLNDFIRHNQLDMILNNEIINAEYFDLYNYEKLYNLEYQEIKENPDSYIDIDEFKELESSEELENLISERASENVAMIEVYQFFIISEYDAERFWDKYTSYPIYYNSDLDVYLLGITHYGMSWSYFSTDFKIRQYL